MRIRLDLYLKRTGLVKRRTMAKRLCDSGSILHNGAAGKGSSKVGVGDLIEIIFDSLDEKTSKKVEILSIPEQILPKQERENSYRLLQC